jgi:outer membrane lipase/esterase
MTAIAAVGLGAVTPVHAQRVVVFGDSLSDTGNATALSGGLVPGSPAGRFSNGLNWIDILYGPTTAYFNPANGFNGVTGNPNGNVNLAVGGATTGTFNVGAAPIGIQTEIASFTAAKGKFAPTDTATMWGGANDLFAITPALSGLPTAQALSLIGTTAFGAVGNEIANLTNLIKLGAKRLVVLNLPDLGTTPAANLPALGGSPQGAQGATAYTGQFNSGLASGLASLAASSPGVNIIQADIAALFKVVSANPGAFGFTNTTTTCFAAGFKGGAGPACTGFLFADPVHPTQAAYAYVAQYVGLVSDPTPALLQQARLSESQLYANEQVTNAVYDRLTNFISGTYADKNGPYVELLGTYGTYDTQGGRPELTLQMGGFRAGIDKKSGPTLTGGSISVLEGSLTAGAIKSDLTAYRFDIYGTALFGNAFVSADAGIAGSSYSGIQRATGIPTVTAKGETSGYVATASAEAGFVLNAGNVTIIPSGRATYYHAKLDGYDEGADVLAMSYAARQTDAFMLGGKVRAVAAVPGLGLASTAFGEIGYETYVSTSGDGVTSTFVNNTALPTTVNPGDPNGPGIIGKLGVSSQVSQGTFLDFQYGISVHDGGGQTHSGDIRLKATY